MFSRKCFAQSRTLSALSTQVLSGCRIPYDFYSHTDAQGKREKAEKEKNLSERSLFLSRMKARGGSKLPDWASSP